MGDRTALTFLRNILSSWVSRMASMVVTFAVTPLLVHGLGGEQYGLWAVAGTLTGYLALLDVGVIGGLVRAISVANSEGKQRRISSYVATAFAFYLLVGLAILAGVYLLQGPLIHLLGVPPRLRDETGTLLFGVTVIMVAANVTAVFNQVFTALEQLHITGIVGLLNTLAGAIAVVIALVALHAGLIGVIVASVAANVAVMVVAALWARLVCPAVSVDLRLVSRAALREIMGVSLVIQLSNVAATVNSSVDKLILAGFVGLTSAGIYDVASRLSLISYMLCWMVAGAAYPVVSRLSTEAPAKIVAFYLRAERYLQLTACGFAGGLIVTAPWLIPLWLGPGYGKVVTAAQILVVATTGWSFTQVAKVTLWGTKRLREMTIFEVWRLSMHIVASTLLTWRFGFYGALIGALISITLPSLWLVWVTHRRFGISNIAWLRRCVAPPLTSALAAGLLAWFVASRLDAALHAHSRPEDLLLTLVAGLLYATIYLLALARFGVFAGEEFVVLHQGRALLWGRVRGVIRAGA